MTTAPATAARRTPRRRSWNDAGLAASSIALVGAAFAFTAERPTLAVFVVTAAATTASMYSRLAIGRWAAAAQLLASGALLGALGAPPRLVGVALGCSLAAVALAPRSVSRAGLLRSASLIAALAGGIVLSGIAAAAPAPLWTRVLGEAAAAVAAGFLAAPSLLAFAPIAEWLFRHVTPLTLAEWLNYDHPLLRELATRAPGTFQHSVSVGLLADAGSRAIGANPLLARVGGLYHDVGKIRAPGYFYENQNGPNPHDDLDPETSADILRAHVADGVELVTAHRMGRIADFVREHHGTGVMHVFRDKAARLGRLTEAAEAQFRYRGPRPRSSETAIVMIADQLEASVRASPPADLAACEAITAQTIERIAASGELADAPLSDRDFDRLRPELARAVFAMYHRRLRYPDPKSPTAAVTVAGGWLGRRGGAA